MSLASIVLVLSITILGCVFTFSKQNRLKCTLHTAIIIIAIIAVCVFILMLFGKYVHIGDPHPEPVSR